MAVRWRPTGEFDLVAAHPAPSVICEMAKGRIRTRDVAGLLDNGRIPDWHTVLHGRSDDLPLVLFA